ncbi:MAG TPA: MFS transporter [Steroidobacteraceae bacterium]|jgi:benzoate transport|nr:MFS transporter [Steroidobacteraceae bacterium]
MSLQIVRQHIESSPLRLCQIVVIALCVAVNMLDGFDILALSLISPTLSREWHLASKTLGLLFSSGLVGTAVGGFALSPIADIWGRRTAILINLGLMSIGMLLSATADSVVQLSVLRFCTGLGVGAMAGCVGTLAFEYCPLKTRALGLGLVVIGYTVGTLLGGYVAGPLIGAFSWHGIFVFGGLCSVLLLALVYFLLPESLDILASRRGPEALANLNKVLSRLHLPAMAALPAPVAKADRGSLLDLLRRPILSRTALMGLSYLLFMMTEYFFLNWNNQLTTNAGFSDSDGLFITRLTSLGGLLGGVVVGLLGVRMPIRRVGALALLGMGFSVVAFGAAGSNLALAQVAATIIGFGIFGAAVAVYATGASTFPARVRATGMGIVMSAGRVGSIFGPYTAGLLLSAQFNRFTVCAILAIPVLLSIMALVKVPLTPVAGDGGRLGLA